MLGRHPHLLRPQRKKESVLGRIVHHSEVEVKGKAYRLAVVLARSYEAMFFRPAHRRPTPPAPLPTRLGVTHMSGGGAHTPSIEIAAGGRIRAGRPPPRSGVCVGEGRRPAEGPPEAHFQCVGVSSTGPSLNRADGHVGNDKPDTGRGSMLIDCKRLDPLSAPGIGRGRSPRGTFARALRLPSPLRHRPDLRSAGSVGADRSPSPIRGVRYRGYRLSPRAGLLHDPTSLRTAGRGRPPASASV